MGSHMTTQIKPDSSVTAPAIWMAPPKSNSFSVSVVFPASGWEMIANVRLLATWFSIELKVVFQIYSQRHFARHRQGM